jgi:hypothetical protein
VSERTKIEWCDYTFSPWWGCTPEEVPSQWRADFFGLVQSTKKAAIRPSGPVTCAERRSAQSRRSRYAKPQRGICPMSAKHPTLFDVPKDSPSRQQRLDVFKKQHGIETHRALGKPSEWPWMAAHLPSARSFGYGVTPQSDLFDCVMKVGRLMDESGVASYGRTEAEAVEAVCKAVGICFSI